MSKRDDSNRKSSGKQKKRRLKEQWKEEKIEAKEARREAKLEKKRIRRAERKVVEHKSDVPRDGAILMLEEIVSGLKAGRVAVEYSGERLGVNPPDQVRVRIRAKHTHKTEGVSIRVSWPSANALEESPSVTIAAGDQPQNDAGDPAD